MKSHTRVVVIGGGVVGCSVLYHLTKFGWTDVVLLERFGHLGGLVAEVFEQVGPHWYHRIDAQFRREEMSALKEIVEGLSLVEVAGYGVRETNRMDGILFELDGGRFLMLRASGTEPVVRIYAEAEEPSAAARLASEGESLLRRALA